MIVKETLYWTTNKLKEKKITSAKLDAEVLLCFVLKKSKEWLYANLDKKISFLHSQELKNLIRRRAKFEPVAYIIGKKEFYGLDFIVNKNALVPRPETEILVDAILDEIKKLKPLSQISILDIGTGSGCIVISLAKNLPACKFFATDVSSKALKIAKQNAKKHNIASKIKFIQSNLFEKIPQQKFNIIVANLPYLNPKTIKQNPELKYEPTMALKAGKNGLDIYQKFFKQVKKYTKKNSKILIEIGDGQVKPIKKIIKKELPEKNIKIIRDLNNIIRVIIIY